MMRKTVGQKYGATVPLNKNSHATVPIKGSFKKTGPVE
jgi:hypothetical protein